MPLAIVLAHRLARRMSEVRVDAIPHLHPDGQAQVSLRYEDRQPVAVEGITLAAAFENGDRVTKKLRDELKASVIDPGLGNS